MLMYDKTVSATWKDELELHVYKYDISLCTKLTININYYMYNFSLLQARIILKLTVHVLTINTS